MKLASYWSDGRATFGALKDDGMVTLGGRVSDGATSLRDALAFDALGEIRALVAKARPDTPLANVEFLPVIPVPGKMICIGINYRDHASETGRDNDAGVEMPNFFLRYPASLVGHRRAMLRPGMSQDFDYEGELAVIMGRGGRHIAEDKALGHVAGYSCFIDGSVRDVQRQSLTAGKNFFASGPFGPWMTTADEIPDPQKLELTTRLNGDVVQHAFLDTMIHPVAKSIAYFSRIAPLEAGDVIATGTPAGVGQRRSPPRWLQPGDRLEVEISGIGILATSVEDDTF